MCGEDSCLCVRRRPGATGVVTQHTPTGPTLLPDTRLHFETIRPRIPRVVYASAQRLWAKKEEQRLAWLKYQQSLGTKGVCRL